MRLKDLRDIFHKELDEIYGKEEVNSFFFMLIEEFYNVHRIDLSMQPETSITKKEQQLIFKALHDLKEEIPIQHIIGKTEFLGMQFQVNDMVLIPRPETEELVQWILDTVEKRDNLNILDIGTGSGCIAIALSKNLPTAQVLALDVSKRALLIAKENAVLNNADVKFIEVNILDEENVMLSLSKHLNKFDIIVSNPPYVRQQEKSEIKKNVIDNEPHLALFVEDDDAFLFYKAIAQYATKNLSENGLLFFEINEYLGKQMIQLLENENFKNIELKKDLYGKDRMIKATL